MTQIFLTVPGAVPALGVDSLGLATQQAVGTWLGYSSSTRDSTALTVTYKTDPTRTVIYRYDPSTSPSVQNGSGMPIFVIKSTGRSGVDRRTIVTQVVRKPVTISLLGAIPVHGATTKLWYGAATHGPFIYNGMNRRADTPTGAGVGGPDPANYVGSGDLPAFWSASAITWGGNRAFVCCAPVGLPVPVLETQPASMFYPGRWTALNKTQSEF